MTSINLTFHSLSCCSSFYHSLSYNLLCPFARAYFFVCFATYGCWHPCDILTSKTHNTLIVPFLASWRFFISIFIVLFLSIRNCFHCLDSSSSFLVYSWIWRARPTIHFCLHWSLKSQKRHKFAIDSTIPTIHFCLHWSLKSQKRHWLTMGFYYNCFTFNVSIFYNLV